MEKLKKIQQQAAFLRGQEERAFRLKKFVDEKQRQMELKKKSISETHQKYAAELERAEKRAREAMALLKNEKMKYEKL